MQWLCTKSGYVHDGDEPPRYCPICQASADDFVENTEENRAKYAHLSVDC